MVLKRQKLQQRSHQYIYLMVEFILEIQWEISDRAGAFRLGQTGPDMRDNGYTIGDQASERWNRVMAAYTRVFGNEIELMVKEVMYTQVEEFMRAIG